ARLGLWMSHDPAGLAAASGGDPQSFNRYAYAGGDPINHIDRLGLNPGCTDKEKSDGGLRGCGDGARMYGGRGPWGPDQGTDQWCGMDYGLVPCWLAMGELEGGGAVACPDNICRGIQIGPDGNTPVYFAATTNGIGAYFPYQGPGTTFSTEQGALAAAALWA